MDKADKTGREPQFQFPWVALILALAAVAIAAFGYAGCKKTNETVAKFGNAFLETAAKFKTGAITHTFLEQIDEITSTRGDVLELATRRCNETFTRTDSRAIAWDWIPLGTTFSKVEVPATFRYHLRLSEPWRLTTKDGVCTVLAPPIRPSLPVAIETDKMQKYTESGWARFDKDENLIQLERSISPALDSRAVDPAHMKLVREQCRQSVGEFVKTWLIKEDAWGDGKFTSIIVVFADEHAVGSDQDLEQLRLDPVVKLPSQEGTR